MLTTSAGVIIDDIDHKALGLNLPKICLPGSDLRFQFIEMAP
ncbi:hypothetical protein NB699_001474 [Xanthomonas sacchari]|nr:hypothetical protein [Xanthomonas sacchari]MCW0395839.1 hypothetical protein [Xanthomonas sacchari]MCW0440484.1 hypothetical protein [Xanthomonas sacchari]MCW0446820.1 hypothetical protein [Xanthomonas sacchari]MCW0447802.1 hypothetical protein [Xanthomonas sacchari]